MSSSVPPSQGPDRQPRDRRLLIALLIVGIIILSLLALLGRLLLHKHREGSPPPTAAASVIGAPAVSPSPAAGPTEALFTATLVVTVTPGGALSVVRAA